MPRHQPINNRPVTPGRIAYRLAKGGFILAKKAIAYLKSLIDKKKDYQYSQA